MVLCFFRCALEKRGSYRFWENSAAITCASLSRKSTDQYAEGNCFNFLIRNSTNCWFLVPRCARSVFGSVKSTSRRIRGLHCFRLSRIPTSSSEPWTSICTKLILSMPARSYIIELRAQIQQSVRHWLQHRQKSPPFRSNSLAISSVFQDACHDIFSKQILTQIGIFYVWIGIFYV